MDRRAFLGTLAGGLLAAPLAAEAQQGEGRVLSRYAALGSSVDGSTETPMRLVFIYGMPGVGKLTTAKALATLTGIRLFHNHLSFDLVKAIFDFPTPPFGRLAETVRLATFEAAAREGLPGLIFTCVYAAPEDDGFVEKTISVVERHGGEVAFVRLCCAPGINEQRVVAEDRRPFTHRWCSATKATKALRTSGMGPGGYHSGDQGPIGPTVSQC